MKMVRRMFTAMQITMGVILAVDAARNFGNPSGMEIFSGLLACLVFYSVIQRNEPQNGSAK